MRILQLILLLLFCVSCRSSLEVQKDAVVSISKEEHERGLNLIAESDCLACHKYDENITGPGYFQISKKYAATNSNINRLALKIMSGGAGSWGSIPMTPHYNLQKNDAVLMVKYILSINNFK